MSNRPVRDLEEVRIEDGSTGGQKGQKIVRYDLIPPSVLDELARVYGMGAAKYSDTNHLKGYSWRLSYGALDRHIKAAEAGESYDEESKLHHLAHAMWHCAALMMFEWYELGDDDRIEVLLEKGELHAEEGK